MIVATHAEIVLQQLNETAVSDRGTSGGLTQFPRTACRSRIANSGAESPIRQRCVARDV